MLTTRKVINNGVEEDVVVTLITVNGCDEYLYFDNNKRDFTKASELFALFDDKNKGKVDDIVKFAQENPDFQITFYGGNTTETVADTFMLTIIFDKKEAYNRLLPFNQHKMDKPYVFGTGTLITPNQYLNDNENSDGLVHGFNEDWIEISQTH